jgi:hypothetical protein
MKNATLQITGDCPYCNATGLRISPEWEQFWEDIHAKELIKANDGSLEKWFDERGYMQRHKRVGMADYKFLPPEEVECWDCEGSKRVTKHITMRELAELLPISKACLLPKPPEPTADGFGC